MKIDPVDGIMAYTMLGLGTFIWGLVFFGAYCIISSSAVCK
jgi:hypothetical protein